MAEPEPAPVSEVVALEEDAPQAAVPAPIENVPTPPVAKCQSAPAAMGSGKKGLIIALAVIAALATAWIVWKLAGGKAAGDERPIFDGKTLAGWRGYGKEALPAGCRGWTVPSPSPPRRSS